MLLTNCYFDQIMLEPAQNKYDNIYLDASCI